MILFIEDTKDNLACTAVFNKINSYKIYLYGLLNDINLYKYFNFFFISKYLTSTGHIFFRQYFLLLQGNKLAFGFITFFKQRLLKTEDIPKVNAIIKEICPEIPDKYFINDGATT